MILLALGSNRGNREEYLAAARAALVAYDIEITASSSVHETPALLPEGAPAEWDVAYLNQVVAVTTHHSPADLLACLKHIEAELGRKPAARWAPREIDLDILAYHDEIVVTDTLVIPHQHMDSREFVLRPMKEIAPDWRHPILGQTAGEMLQGLRA